MSFRPSIHGWPFGRVAGTESHALGPFAPPAGNLGLGGGLCWSALDRYLRGVGIPPGVERPEPGDELYTELVRRQVAAVEGVWRRASQWQARPDGSWRDRLPIPIVPGRDLASLSRAEWRRIRKSLDAATPILLTLLDPADGYRRHHAVRQLLATDWKLDDARIVLSVYDPDRPGDDRVHLSFAPAGPLDCRLNGSAVRGFWATPYDRVPPSSVRVESFGDRSVIGLNRHVGGALAVVGGRRRIDVVARNERRALLHFRRSRGESWEGSNITDRDGLGSYELHSDPAIVRSVGLMEGGLHVFARSYVGDLLHFQSGRKWRATNRTDHRRTGSGFRLTGRPVAVVGPWGRLSVLGRGQDGGLIHYTARPPLGWRAERVPGDPLLSDPVATWVGSTLHVAGINDDGDVQHREWNDERWTVTEPGHLRAANTAARVAGPVALSATNGSVCLAARSVDDRLMVVCRSAAGGWDARELGAGVSGDPVATTGPAGVHVFAATRAGTLLHAWRADDWCEEELPTTRPSLPPIPSTTGLACWGTRDELRVWGRTDDDLWSLVWRADADWTLERMTDHAGVSDRHRPGDDPLVARDGAGLPHLFFTDGHGTVLHMEPSEWREPRVGQTAGDSPVRCEPAPETEPVVAREARPEPGLEIDTEAELEGALEIETMPEIETLPDLETRLDPEPGPRLDPEPGTPPGPDSPSGAWAPADGKDFRWRRAGSSPDPSEIEPIDLSLLEGWPFTPTAEPTPEKREKADPNAGNKESA